MQDRNHASPTRALAQGVVALCFAAIVSLPAQATEVVATAKGDPGITLSVRLAVDPLDPPPNYDFCGATSSLIAYTGENVRWCYRVTNDSGTSLIRHDLQTVRFGAVLSNFPYTLGPAATAFLTQVAPATTSLFESATWRAYNPGTANDFSDAASALLTVRPGIELVVTVSLDPDILPPGYDQCGTQTAIAAVPGRNIRWCYRIANASSIPRTRHTLAAALAGSILTDFPYTLAPQATAFITRVQTMPATDLQESATWTAYRPGPVHVSTSTASASVFAATDAIFANGFQPD